MEKEMIISLIATGISIGSLILSIITNIESVKRERKQATLNAFNTLQNEALDKLYHYTEADIRKITENSRTDEYKEVSVLLARWEHFCVGVNSDIYDIKTVKRLAGKYLIGLYKKVSPLIEKKRKINTTDKHYDEIEKMIEKIDKLYK